MADAPKLHRSGTDLTVGRPARDLRSANYGGKTSEMARHMRAAVLRKLRTLLRIEKLPEPEPGPGELLIRITACGVCHSDLHAIDGDWTPGPVLPLIPGHEVTGHVVALGSGVAGFKPGDAVGVP
jgi:alcohol dehydrogenase, propanol-preferring